MKTDERVKEAVTRMRLVNKKLLADLRDIVEINPGIKNIEFRASGKRSLQGSVNFGCIITVEGDNQGEADKHCLEMTEQGCSCQSIGPAMCECDC